MVVVGVTGFFAGVVERGSIERAGALTLLVVITRPVETVVAIDSAREVGIAGGGTTVDDERGATLTDVGYPLHQPRLLLA